MKTKKGFTLIELLAVIVILAVIALIATPLVMNTINDAKVGSQKSSVRNILSVAELEYAKAQLDGDTSSITFDSLEYKGEQFEKGSLSFNADGVASVAVYTGSACIYKTDSDEDVVYDKDLSETDCLAKVNGGGSTTVSSTQDLIKNANNATIKNYTDGNTSEMYTFTHGSTIDYRYIGSTPNNYITFNNETWRIIGVFDGKIKIIRNESIGNNAWDSSYANDWTTASLNTTLSTYLSEDALANVAEVTWYLGGSSSSSGHSATTYYEFERGTTVYSGRPTTWTGKVALMYPSDYAYTFAYGVNDKCYTDTNNCKNETPSASWLYSKVTEWTLSPSSDYWNGAFRVDSSGRDDGGCVEIKLVVGSFGVRPVVYLKSDISLSGTGTASDPYIILT